MKIHVLAENTAISPEYHCKHGLSLLAESGKCTFLFDFGQSDLFFKNSLQMGVNLESVCFGVLSHGHYDHGGGLPLFLEKNHTAPVYVSPHAYEPHYKGYEKFIGLAPLQTNRLVPVYERQELAPGIWLDPWKDERTSSSTQGMFVKDESGWHPDNFSHEQYLIIYEQDRKILFSGCSHRGILSIMDHFRPDILVGGFHFKDMDPDSLTPYAKALLEFPTQYYTCHCTGISQYKKLKSVMGSRLEYISSGMSLII